MVGGDERDATGWVRAIRTRRATLLQRMAIGGACAMVFGPLLGWRCIALWASAYFLTHLIEAIICGPVNAGRAETLGPARNFLAGVVIVIGAILFGALSIPLWLMGGIAGGVCAVILVAGSAMYGAVNTPTSRTVTLCAATPPFLYLLMTTPFLVRAGADTPMATAAIVSSLLFIAFGVCTWTRITASRAAETAARIDANRKRDEAESAMADRSAFLAAVGHDLRTPIGAIMTGAAELERRAADSSDRAHASLISEAGLMMKALLDDLLDHARIEAGRMTVEEQAFNLRATLAHTLRFWQGAAREKGLRLRVEGASSAPAWVRGDPMRLRQILNNLISNALKFTLEGAVCVRIQSWFDEPSGYSLLIEVRDTGPGMDRDQLARLFTPFDQTQDGVSALYGGSGLGLAISRELASLMGGRLTARSIAGEGSTFTLALSLPRAAVTAGPATLESEGRAAVRRALSPNLISAPSAAESVLAALRADDPASVAEPEPPPLAEAAAPSHAPSGAPSAEAGEDEAPEGRALRVLVVDDHEINRRAVQLILAPLGAEIATADDGMAALAATQAAAYDVIFMDVRMPELDGREATRRLRATPGPNRTTPVVAVTADSEKEDVEACMAAGMDYFVSKPLTPAALLGALGAVLEAGASAEPLDPALNGAA